MKEGEEAVRAQTRSTGLQMYTGLEAGEVELDVDKQSSPHTLQVKVTNVFLPVCHAFSLHRNHLVTVSVAPRGDRLDFLPSGIIHESLLFPSFHSGLNFKLKGEHPGHKDWLGCVSSLQLEVLPCCDSSRGFAGSQGVHPGQPAHVRPCRLLGQVQRGRKPGLQVI